MSRNNQFRIDLGQGSSGERDDPLSGLTDVELTLPISNDEALLYENGKWKNKAVAGGTSTYSNPTPTPTAVGGVEAGTTFDNVTIEDVLNDLFYPYVAINATSLSADVGNSTREKGDTITATINFTANYNLGSLPLTDITFKRAGVIQQSGLSSTWAETVDITDNVTFSAEVSDGTTTDTVNRSYSFVYPFYYGVDSPGLTPTAIRTNFGATVTGSGDKVYSFAPTNQVYYFAYPASYGLLTRVLDWNNFDITGDFTVRTENLTGLDGSAQSYYIYEFNNLVTHAAQNLTFDT